MDDCIFCSIGEGKSPATVEAETDNVIAFRSIEPVASTHILIIPKKHIETFDDIKEEDAEVMMEIMQTIQSLTKELNISKAYKVAINAGSYQVIPHLHWHLLGGELKGKDVLDNT